VEFEVSGQAYSVGTIPLLTSVEIIAKLSPMFAMGLFDYAMFQAKAASEEENEKHKFELILLFPGITREFAKMTSEDRNSVIIACLSACTRKVPGGGAGGWAPVWAVGATSSNFPDLNSNMLAIFEIVFNVLRIKFGAFFFAALSLSSGGAGATNSTPSK
jgi:hypothetical protein